MQRLVFKPKHVLKEKAKENFFHVLLRLYSFWNLSAPLDYIDIKKMLSPASNKSFWNEILINYHGKKK